MINIPKQSELILIIHNFYNPYCGMTNGEDGGWIEYMLGEE